VTTQPTMPKTPDRASMKPTAWAPAVGPSPPLAPLSEASAGAQEAGIRLRPGDGGMFVVPQRSVASPDPSALPLLRVLARVALEVAEREVKMERQAS
jgi:hypothetical protein